MKKYFKIAVFTFLLVILTGCTTTTNLEEEKMKCTRTMNQNGIKTELIYKVTYKGDYVTEVESIETIESDSKEVLELYEEQVNNIYSAYDNIEYYDYKVEIVDNKLTSTAIINYEKIDTDKLLEIDSANGQLIKDGKINIKDIKSVYESLGTTCEKD